MILKEVNMELQIFVQPELVMPYFHLELEGISILEMKMIREGILMLQLGGHIFHLHQTIMQKMQEKQQVIFI